MKRIEAGKGLPPIGKEQKKRKHKKETIQQICEEVATEICDNYCKYPLMKPPKGKDEDWLFEDGGLCESCPLNRIN